MALGTSSLDPEFAKRVDAWLRACESMGLGVRLISALRTYNEQLALWEKLTPQGKRVARPGHSCHELGFAIDVACKFGFRSPHWERARGQLRFFRLDQPFPDPNDDPGHIQDTIACNEARKGVQGAGKALPGEVVGRGGTGTAGTPPAAPQAPGALRKAPRQPPCQTQ